MPGSLTYTPRTPDDPSFVSVGNYRFESNKKLGNIDDTTMERLKGNPWFTPGREAQKAADAAVAPQPQLGDSSVNLAPPPGSGSKTDPGGLVKTGEGLVPVDEADETVGEYVIKHKGRGKFDVLQDDETVQSGLSREDAEAWVAARSA